MHVPPGSLVRAVAPLLDFRDPATVSPLDPTAHGLGLDRLSSLLTGFRDGAAACPEMTIDDLPLTLGREGVTTSPPSTLPRFASTADVLAAATSSVADVRRATSSGIPAGQPTAPDPADLTLAAPLGQFAAASAVALAAGRAITGTDDRCRGVLHRRLGGVGVRAGRGRRAGLLADRRRRGDGPDPLPARGQFRRARRVRRRVRPGLGRLLSSPVSLLSTARRPVPGGP